MWQGWRAAPGSAALAFCVGVLAAVWLPVLPAAHYAVLGAALACCLCLRRSLRPAGCLLAGLCYHIGFGHQLLAQEIPAAWEALPLVIEGQVVGLPQRRDYGEGRHSLVFDLRVEQVRAEGGLLRQPRPLRLRLHWFDPQPLQPGQRWRLPVALQRPRSLLNPGGFDYRIWLLARGIGGTGKVLAAPAQRLHGAAPNGLMAVRYWYRRALERALGEHPAGPLVAAIALGDRQQLTPAQREVLAATGTAHLLVISGLHIGLSAMAGFAACYLVTASRPVWVQSGAALLAARLGGLLVALGYAALSGFGLPAQRALLMLALIVAALTLARNSSPWRVLLLALCGVLVLDPLAGTSAGFWLSFGAVALLLVPARRAAAGGGRIGRVLALQWRLLLGMCPLMAVWIGQTSVLAPLVNLVAIPVVGLLLVPALLVALVALPVSEPFGQALLQGVAWLLQLSWQGLALAAEAAAPWARHNLFPSLPALALAALAALLLLLPRGFPGRPAWPLLLLPLLAPAPRSGFDLYVLDVGQGTAVVVRVGPNVLVYDAGPAYRSGYDAGSAVLLPFLRRQGLARIERLIVSHADTDHSGGVRALLAQLPVGERMAPRPLTGVGDAWTACRAGQSWRWGGVAFALLNPPAALPARTNDQSCVLQIDTGRTRFLLAGDIGRPVEQALAAAWGRQLAADVLLVPHHGSRSSSSYDFTWFVRPRLAVVSAGYRNRFGHPAAAVVERYRELGAEVVSTAATGALHFSDRAGYAPYAWFYTRYWQNYPCQLSASARAAVGLAAIRRAQGAPGDCGPPVTGAVEATFLW